jgi:hypothetical protein
MGNAYVTGHAEGALFSDLLGNSDAYLIKYDESGNAIWSRQFGTTGSEFGAGIVADESGNIYVAGSTSGSLGGSNRGDLDAFLRKYDADGTELWTKQLGTLGRDAGLAVAIDNRRVYLLGAASGAIGNSYYSGGSDVFVSAFTEDGDALWNYQFGSAGSDAAYNLARDAVGSLYLAGATDGNLAGFNAGIIDAILVKLDAVDAPGDYNRDGVVDTADYVVWRRQLGTSGPQGDGTGWDGAHLTGRPDGIVDDHDFAFWKANFGAAYDTGAIANVAAPEPSMWFLVFCVATVMGCCRRDSMRSERKLKRRSTQSSETRNSLISPAACISF